MLFDSPSTFGRAFRILSFGESHGPAVGVVMDGVKPGLPFDLEEIQKEMDRHLGRPEGTSRKLKTFVQDRAGYDRRYAIDATKIQKELGWEAGAAFTEGLQRTVARYAS